MKKDIEVYIFDLDGCIYSGNELYGGSNDVLNKIRTDGKKIIFLTNNSTHTSSELREKLLGMKLDIKEEDTVFTATDLVGKYLFRSYGKRSIKVIGTRSLENALRDSGHIVYPLECDTVADYLVIGRDVDFDYEKMYKGAKEVRRGTKIMTVNGDISHPDMEGYSVPESGVLSKVIRVLAENEEHEVCGKPTAYVYEYILEKLKVEAKKCVMVGDNLLTDIKGAVQAGMNSIWISHGKDVPKGSEVVPQYTVKNIKNILEII